MTNWIDNYNKATIGENLASSAYKVLGFSVNNHNINDGGCDIVATSNGIKVVCEVNNFKEGGYFKDDRIDRIDANLITGMEYVDYKSGYRKNEDANFKIHICFGADRNLEQYKQSTELGIAVIHFPQLPSLSKLVHKLKEVLGINPYLSFHKLSCIETIPMELYYYIYYNSYIYSNILLSIVFFSVYNRINGSCDTALTKFLTKIQSSNQKCPETRSNSMSTSVSETVASSTIATSGCTSKDEIISPSSYDLAVQPTPLEFSASTQYCLVTEDSEYRFSGSKVSENYVESLWNSTIANFPMPKITVILVAYEMLANVASGDSYSTLLIPQRDCYLVLISFKDNQQFKQTLSRELMQIWVDAYVASLRGEELLKFQQLVKEKAKSAGCKAPMLLPNNSIYY